MFEKVFYFFWVSVKSSPFLYRLFLCLMGRYQKGFFPNGTHELHLAGYQRSGNTFSERLVRAVAPDISIATHVHTAATLRLALKHEIPVVCLIRHPDEAVASSYVMNESQGKSRFFARASLYEYVAYYEFVLRHRDVFRVCVFEQFISDPKALVRAVLSAVGFDIPQDVDPLVKEVIYDLQKDDCDGQKLSPLASNWKNEAKESQKSAAISSLREHPLYPRALELYSLLSKGSPG